MSHSLRTGIHTSISSSVRFPAELAALAALALLGALLLLLLLFR